MSAQHTLGRLVVRGGYSIYTTDGTPVADTCLTASVPQNDEANARRLVACWNACNGIPVEVLEAVPSGPAGLLPMYARLQNQRDELLAALEKIAGFTLSQFMGPHDMALECVTVACDAIAKVKGGAA